MKDIVTFCTGCFATNKTGSWGTNGCEVEYFEHGGNYCANCGSGGRLILIPCSSAEDIRSNASWVGKRYYPIKEDFWNELSFKIGKMKTIFFRFKLDRCEVSPRKFGFTWTKRT